MPKTGSSALSAALRGKVFLHPMKHISGHNARRLISVSELGSSVSELGSFLGRPYG